MRHLYLALYAGEAQPENEIRGVGYERKPLGAFTLALHGDLLSFVNAEPLVWDGPDNRWIAQVTHSAIVDRWGVIYKAGECPWIRMEETAHDVRIVLAAGEFRVNLTDTLPPSAPDNQYASAAGAGESPDVLTEAQMLDAITAAMQRITDALDAALAPSLEPEASAP